MSPDAFYIKTLFLTINSDILLTRFRKNLQFQKQIAIGIRFAQSHSLQTVAQTLAFSEELSEFSTKFQIKNINKMGEYRRDRCG